MDKGIASSFKKLKSSSKFKEFVVKNKSNYLASCFKMGDSKLTGSAWQFDFYAVNSKKMTSFQVGNEITVNKDQEIFAKAGAPMELELNRVKIEIKKAMIIANNYKTEKLPHETVNKEIVILQELENKPVWNLTLLTSAFNIVNIKIDAFSGKILSSSCESIMSFKLN